MYGSIYFKQNKIENRKDNNKDKNIYTLYSCAYNIESETNVKSTIKKINIDLKGKKIESQEDLVANSINVKDYSLGKEIKVNEIYENKEKYRKLDASTDPSIHDAGGMHPDIIIYYFNDKNKYKPIKKIKP